MAGSIREEALLDLGRWLLAREYRFTTVTPETHARVLERFGGEPSGSLRDVFGWNRPFVPSQLSRDLFALMHRAGACQPDGAGSWRATVRFSSLADLLFVHSAFPTSAADSVFFGPDTYRFVRAVLPHAPRSGRLVDVGCGSGAGGIVVSKWAGPGLKVVLADINEGALAMARVNANLAGVEVEVTRSDVLREVEGPISSVIANPPYLSDAQGRVYRDGGGRHGSALSLRIAREALARMAADKGSGQLLLYTGAAIVGGKDALRDMLTMVLKDFEAHEEYAELDPDVFGGELELSAYRDVERIAAVFLQATLP